MWLSALSALLIGLYLTFSRTIIAVWLLSWIAFGGVIWFSGRSSAWENIKEVRRKLKVVALTVLVVSLCFSALLWPLIVARITIATSDEAVQLRIKYNSEALSSGADALLRTNWIGVGIGNFTTWLSRYDRSLPSYFVQPAHNIYLLAYSEIGALGLLVWLLWLGSCARMLGWAYRHQPLLGIGLGILFMSTLGIGLLDHFYWTLQQGRILWWATLALAADNA